MSTRPARYAGKYPLSLALDDELSRLVSLNPLDVLTSPHFRCAIFRSLGRGDYQIADDFSATIAEHAYVRWLDVALIVGAAPAAELADWLRIRHYNAVRFPAWAFKAPLQEVIDAIGLDAATSLMDVLQGQGYLVPCMAWNAETARTILADIQREAEFDAVVHTLADQDVPDGIWTLCPERLALFDACEPQP